MNARFLIGTLVVAGEIFFICPKAIGSDRQNTSPRDSVPTSSSTLYSGVDARGNFFRGNKSTGFYYNYGTKETCIGLNKKRRCFIPKS